MTPPAPRRIAAPPSPEAARRQRKEKLTALRGKGASRTPAEARELLDLLADHILKDDEG